MAASNFKGALLSGLMGRSPDMTNALPQSQPLDERQVPNNAGGFTFQIDDMARLRRFLIIGSEGGTYYVTEQKLTLEAARGVKALLDAGKGLEVVREILTVSTEGRAPKQGPGVFALALCCRLGDVLTKRSAFGALPKVCRTASALFDFVAYCKAINQEVAEADGRVASNASWGRAMRHAVANWYLAKTPMALAYQVTKYVQRGGWSNRDLLRLAHPQPAFIRTAAARQEAAKAAGELEKASLASPAAGDGEDNWDLVDDAMGVRSVETADDSAAALDQRVEEMQRVFRFIVDEEAPPATDADGRVAAYLAAAHRLKKAQMVQPLKEETAEEAATDPAAAEAQPGAASDTAAAPAAAVAEPETLAAGGAEAAKPAKKRRVEKKPKAPVAPISEADVCDLIKRHRFSREHIGDTRLLKRLDVWGALLGVGMPFTALTRSLGRLTSLGAFNPARCNSAEQHLAAVTARFSDANAMKAARAHPIVLLNALRVYATGHGDLGGMSWEPHPAIKAALDVGFYHAFRNVAPTGKRFLLGVDVSGSMSFCKCAGMSALTPRDAAAAVAMCLLRTEGEAKVTSMAFSTTFEPLSLRAGDSLEAALQKTADRHFGGTDCAQPMVYALEKGLKVDCFVVLTDSETWSGGIHPTEALRQYRAETGIDARLLVLAFAGTAYSIADPEDRGMLDIPGLDAGVPEVMRQFVLGEL